MKNWSHSFKNIFFTFQSDKIYTSHSRVLFLVGSWSLLIFTALRFLTTDIADFFAALAIVAMFASYKRAPNPAKHDHGWKFLAGAILLAIFVYIWTNLFLPEFAEPYPNIEKLAKLWLFFPVAWWLAGNPSNVHRLFAAYVAGLVVSLVISANWDEISRALDGRRIDFGFRNAQHIAVFSSVGFLAWFALGARFLRLPKKHLRPLRILLFCISGFVLSFAVVVTQTRAAWIGLGAALFFLVPWLFFNSSPTRWSRHLLGGGTVALLAVTMMLSPVIVERFGASHEAIKDLLSGEVQKIPDPALRLRVEVWSETWAWFRTSPFVGFGYHHRSEPIKRSETLPKRVVDDFGHYHNSLIEMAMGFGLLGVSFLLGLFIWVFRAAYRSWRAGVMPADHFGFFLSFSIFWIIVNMFESYVIWSTGSFVMALVWGTAYTYHLAAKLKIAEEQI